MSKTLKIVVPLAGAGKSFKEAGYTFPKPLIDVNGKPMIQLVVENLRPKCKHEFIFVVQQEQYQKYSLHEIFENATKGNYKCVLQYSGTQGAACSVLNAIDYINTTDDLIIANSDQIIDVDIDKFIDSARKSKSDGMIMIFKSSHPKWSFVRIDKNKNVIEVAEKKVISENATVGIYYFKEGKLFVEAACNMIEKDIRTNNDFYVCPVYNEMILNNKKITTFNIKTSQMHGLGTPEDLKQYLDSL